MEKISDSYKVVSLSALGYTKNISLRRFFDQKIVARNFLKLAPKFNAPSIVLSAMPTIELTNNVHKFCKPKKIPYIVDIRDLWPDIYERAIPGALKPFWKYALRYLRSELKCALRDASSVTGVHESYVTWAQEISDRSPSPYDKPYYNAYDSSIIRSTSCKFSRRLDDSNTNTVVGCYIGSIRNQMDFDPWVKALSSIRLKKKIKLVFAGPMQPDMQNDPIFSLPNVDRVGVLGKDEIGDLLANVDFAIAPYRDTFDFNMSFPTKIIEYLAGGLPIFTSLSGETKKLLKSEQCGFSYNSINLEKYLIQILDPNLLSQMKYNAKSKFEESFSEKNVYSSWCKDIILQI